MGKSPKSNEEKMQMMIDAWENIARDKSFGQMTLAEFKAIALPAQTARKRLRDLAAQTIEATNAREIGDEAFFGKAEFVINGVRADPNYGPNSTLYEAMGYTRQSERKSGLARKKTPPEKP